MHISKIYIQDNFVPDYDTDPFRRKVIGMEVTIQEKENAGDGIADLEKRISEYITSNTIPPTHSMRGTQVRDLEPEQVYSPKESMIRAIQSCTEIDGADGLLSFKRLSENDAEIKAVYDLQFLKLKK